MGALLAFAPFAGFAFVERLLGIVPGLATGSLISATLLVRHRMQGQRDVDMLEVGSAVMFTALAVLAFENGGQAWSLWRVRLWVDGGLLLIAVAGIAVGRPFTLQHARRRVAPEVARGECFLHTNIVLSGAWALAFAVLVAADALMVMRPHTPVQLAVGLTVAALVAAAWFTNTYTLRARSRASDSTARADVDRAGIASCRRSP